MPSWRNASGNQPATDRPCAHEKGADIAVSPLSPSSDPHGSGGTSRSRRVAPPRRASLTTRRHRRLGRRGRRLCFHGAEAPRKPPDPVSAAIARGAFADPRSFGLFRGRSPPSFENAERPSQSHQSDGPCEPRKATAHRHFSVDMSAFGPPFRLFLPSVIENPEVSRRHHPLFRSSS